MQSGVRAPLRDKPSPPARAPVGDSDGRVIRQRRGKPPTRCRIAPPAPAPPGFSPGDARGEAPCIRKPKNSPFPGGEERSASAGRGDRGKKFMMRQAQPATKTATPHRGQRRQGYPATPGQAPRLAQDCAPCPRAARVQSRGCKGRSPLHKKTKNLPLPHGGRALCERGSGGWGKNFLIWLVNPATKKSSHPSKPTAAKKTVSRRRRTPLPPCSQSTSSTRQSGRTVRSDGCSTYRRINLKAEA